MRSGGSDYAFWLCRRLAAAGLEVEVVTSQIEGLVGDPAFRVFPLMKRWSWREMPRLLRFLRRSKPDLVNLHFQNEIYHNHPMISLVPVLVKRQQPAPRVVTHFETPDALRLRRQPRRVRAVRRALVRWFRAHGLDYGYGGVLTHSDAVIVLSERHQRTLEEVRPGVGGKCVLIPPPPNLRFFPGGAAEARQRGRELLGIPPGDEVIAFFGYLYPGRGLETLFQAFALLAGRRPGVRLLVIGGDNQVSLRVQNRPNYLAELQELAQKEGVADRVIWTGYCAPENDRGSLYLYSADLCALPFDYGICLNNSSFAAAAAHGLPIVTTRGLTLEAPFADGENVLLCRPKDPPALAGAIEAVLAGPAWKRKLGAGALALAEEWFSAEASLERTLKVFQPREG